MSLEYRALLEKAVIIASVTPAEQRRLGGIYVQHKGPYCRMLKGQVSRLHQDGMVPYSATGITLKPKS